VAFSQPMKSTGREEKRLDGDLQPVEMKSVLSAEAILDQLQRILASPDFDATDQQRALLKFVISQTLAGNSGNIKGYTIATQVFGRGENFDQAIDPIVSIQANKLRRSLERYYLLSGKNDPVHIDIPKGTYVPLFTEHGQNAPIPAPRRTNDQDARFEKTGPTILIKPFQNLTVQPEKNYWGAGFAAELANEINRYKWIPVLQYSSEGTCRRGTDSGARFIAEGSIREDETGVKVTVNLIDTATNSLIWSEHQRVDKEVTKIIAFQEKVASKVGAMVAGEQGIISRTLLGETMDSHPDQLLTYEALLYYHHYDQTLEPEDFAKAFEALQKARINEPGCGQVWTFLARLYANIYSLEIPGFDVADAEQKALEYAEKGADLNPDSQVALGVLSLVRMFSHDIVLARRNIDRAYQLNPSSLILMDGIGYIKTLLGEWEEGPALIRKAMKLNPYYRPVVHYALWVDYLRQNDFEKAYLETTELRRPAVFWYPLAKASTLGLLGRIDEGKKFSDDLLQLKPDFKERGRRLLRRYIKFDDIADRVIEGLHKVGVETD
jgi:adenylate cyclase